MLEAKWNAKQGCTIAKTKVDAAIVKAYESRPVKGQPKHISNVESYSRWRYIELSTDQESSQQLQQIGQYEIEVQKT